VRLYDFLNQLDSEITTIIQPHIVVICDQSKLDEKGCRGAPDLIIETLSPTSLTRDSKTKLNLYQKHGVKEYWIVNPGDKTSAIFLIDKTGNYGAPSVYRDHEKIASLILKGIDISGSDIFG
jgi:Uma2 family endonuclease